MTRRRASRTRWKAFNAGIKRWAYRQDQLPTTHPIAGRRAATPRSPSSTSTASRTARARRSSSSSSKSIGRDAFRDGLRLYFRRHAWGNATLADFLAALEEAHGASLEEWAEKWLRTASLNTIAAKWQAEDGRMTELGDRADGSGRASDAPRPHAFEIGFVSDAEGKITISTSVLLIGILDILTPAPLT